MPSNEATAAALLRRARRRRGSEAEFARRAGIPTSRLSAYESSTVQPSVATFVRLLEVAGVGLGLADPRAERLRRSEELVAVLGLVDALPVRKPSEHMTAMPFRDLIRPQP